jgi:hypothetical protein
MRHDAAENIVKAHATMNDRLDQSMPNQSVPPAQNEANGQSEAALMRWIERLEALLEAETSALLRGQKIDFEGFNAKKNHALRDFMVLSRSIGAATPPLKMALERLDRQLTRNGEALKQNLQAASEISKLLISAIRAEESDGTYSRRSSLRANERL